MVQVMESDGYVPEGDMVNAVLDLAILHRMGTHIDVLSMSFGYYHEAPDDVRTDASLGQALGALADAGTLLVASAGNDATTRRMFPAALDTRPDHKPLNVVAVGALNPNGTVALFSNDGDWVDCHERGRVGAQHPADHLRRKPRADRANDVPGGDRARDHRPGRLPGRVRGVVGDLVRGARSSRAGWPPTCWTAGPARPVPAGRVR